MGAHDSDLNGESAASGGAPLTFVDLAMTGAGELRLVDPDTIASPGDLVGAAVFQAVNAVEVLGNLDHGMLDGAALRQWAEGIEHVRRMVDLAATEATGRVDRTAPYTDEGFFNAKTWLRHRLQLSGPEAYRRVQTARMRHRLADWDMAARVGGVGVAQSELMARVAANPRIGDDILQRDQRMLLDDAQTQSFDEFQRRLRTWEALADPSGDRSRASQQHLHRHVHMRGRPEGGWTLSGSLDELSGSEFNEILAHFVDAEWRADWAEARGRLGEAATTGDLCRTADQRNADALLAMARAAASAHPGMRGRPTVNFLVDVATFEAGLQGQTREPRRYRDVVCRTQSGRRLATDDAINAALTGHIRRAVYDSAGTIIDLGRRSRLFRGAARDAVNLTATECIWLGCDQPVHWCDTDHSLKWAAHGATVPRNGAPLCRRHNLHKERGFQIHRDSDGNWHFINPEGDEIR